MDYIEFARTSYFPPKNKAKAKADAEHMGARLVENGGKIAFIFDEGTPSCFPTECWGTHPAWDEKIWGMDQDEDHAGFLYHLLQWHLAEENGLVLTAIGYEGSRYYDAWAAIIPAVGAIKWINLEQEIKKACMKIKGVQFAV